MKRIHTIYLLPIVIFFIFSFSGCVQPQDVVYLNGQIVALNKRVTQLQESVDNKPGSDTLDLKLESVHANQATINTDFERLKSDIQTLSGRVEDNEHIIKRTVERELDEQDSTKKELSELLVRVDALELMVRQQQEYLNLEPKVGKKGKETQTVIVPVAPKGPTGTQQNTKSKELKLYEDSLASYQTGKYEESMAGFKGFLKKYPKSDVADNAQFWIGQCFMALMQHEQAILAFQEVIKKYPKGNKVASALLRQAVAFLEINDKTSARIRFKNVIKDYPKSNEAKIANKKLKSIN